MGLYVNSGNTIVHNEHRYHAGTKVPPEQVSRWTKDDIERLIDQGVITDSEPRLDPSVDARTGSAAIDKGQPRPKTENFSSKQLNNELTAKQKKAADKKAKAAAKKKDKGKGK